MEERKYSLYSHVDTYGKISTQPHTLILLYMYFATQTLFIFGTGLEWHWYMHNNDMTLLMYGAVRKSFPIYTFTYLIKSLFQSAWLRRQTIKSITIHEDHTNLTHRLFIDYQYQSINWYRLVWIDIDCHRFHRLETPGIVKLKLMLPANNYMQFLINCTPCDLPCVLVCVAGKRWLNLIYQSLHIVSKGSRK